MPAIVFMLNSQPISRLAILALRLGTGILLQAGGFERFRINFLHHFVEIGPPLILEFQGGFAALPGENLEDEHFGFIHVGLNP